jgi:hypothetical protein
MSACVCCSRKAGLSRPARASQSCNVPCTGAGSVCGDRGDSVAASARGAVGQHLARLFQLMAQRRHPRGQRTLVRRGFVGVGDGRVAQREALAHLGQRALHCRMLALRQVQALRGQHQVKVALAQLQHPVLARGLPFQLRGVARQLQLALLRPRARG